MSKIFVSLWNKKSGTYSHEYVSSFNEIQLDRYGQLALTVTLRVVDDKDPGDFLGEDLRNRAIQLMAQYWAEGKADSSRRDVEDDFEDMLAYGNRGYHESTDLEVFNEYSMFFEDSSTERYVNVLEEMRAALAIHQTLTS